MGRNYSVMLVDDEEDVIRAIVHRIDWEEIGLSVPRYAHNGLEALEMAEEDAPDIVMTDIKMPYMDGLELSRKLKEQYPNIRVIIFSGFDEFEYAREAIRLEAEEYLLKPLNAAELRKSFIRIREQLDREHDEQQNVKKLQEYYAQSLPLLREEFYSALMEGKIPEGQLARDMENYQIDLTGPLYCIAVLHTSSTVMPEGFNPLLLTVSIRKLAEERLDDSWRCRFFSYLGNTAVVAQFDAEGDVTRFTDDCDRFCRLAKSVFGAVVTVGIGQICRRVGDLPSSYQGARNAVSYRVIYGTGQAINIAEIAPQERDSGGFEDDELRTIFKMIRMDEPEPLKKKVAEYITKGASAQVSVQGYHFFVMGLVGELYRFAKNNELDGETIFRTNDDIYQRIQQLDPEEVTEWMTDVCLRMQKMVQDKRTDTTRSFVSRAIEYVYANYAREDISVDSVCSYLGVSAAYFSTVFKRETGKTFINFLTDYRMERAVELLIERNEKTYVIARQVGYSDPNYFSYVFKKQFGMSPSKYKSQRTES